MGVADHVCPPSTDIESAMPSTSVEGGLAVKRESSHATYTAPVDASTAIAGSDPPERTALPILASTMPTLRTVATRSGGPGQVIPLSVERRTLIVMLSGHVGLLTLQVMTSMTFSKVPSGSTATTLPIVCALV